MIPPPGDAEMVYVCIISDRVKADLNQAPDTPNLTEVAGASSIGGTVYRKTIPSARRECLLEHKPETAAKMRCLKVLLPGSVSCYAIFL